MTRPNPTQTSEKYLNLNLHSHVIYWLPLSWQLLWMRVPEQREWGEPPSGHVIYSRLCREKKMVFTSWGLVSHIPCFNHSTTHFHTWMLTRLECGSRNKHSSGWFAKDFPLSFVVFREGDVAFVHLLEWGGLWSTATKATNICWVQQPRPWGIGGLLGVAN